MDWHAGDLEKLSFFTFTVDDLALRGCSEQNARLHPCSGGAGAKPSPIDLARSRVRDTVMISGENTKLGDRCDPQANDWEESTNTLAQTLEGAALVVIEDGDSWKVIRK